MNVVTQYVYASTTAIDSAVSPPGNPASTPPTDPVVSPSTEQPPESTQTYMALATTDSEQVPMTAPMQLATTISQQFAAASTESLVVATTIAATVSVFEEATTTVASGSSVVMTVLATTVSVQSAASSGPQPSGATTVLAASYSSFAVAVTMTPTQTPASHPIVLLSTSSLVAPSTSASFSSSRSLSSLQSSLITVAVSSAPTPTSTSRSNNNASTTDLASNSHSPMFWVGIVFAVIVALACIAAFLAWTIRVRTRSKRHALEQSTFWPWDRGRNNSFADDDGHLETGFNGTGDDKNESTWSQGEKQTRGSAFRSGDDSDMLTAQESNVLTDSCFLPRPPAAAYLQNRLVGPYPTIQVNDGTQSVPDLAPDLGSLQVTNLMPGDVSSCDLTSRGDEPNFSPDQRASNFVNGRGSHFLSANEAGRGAHGTFFQAQSTPRQMLADSPVVDWQVEPDANDGQTQESTESEGWAASLRTNLFSAFNAVVGGNHPEDPFGDNFTRPPLRRERSRRGNTTTSSLNAKHEKTLPSLSSSRNDTIFEDVEEGVDVFQRGMQGRSAAPSRPPAAIVSRDRFESSLGQTGQMSRTNSEQSEASTAQLGYLADTPRMPEELLPADIRRSGHVTSKRSKVPSREITRKYRRPPLPPQQSSPALSMFSDLSRESSERLTAQEELAKKLLKERRTRILQMGDSRTRITESKLVGDGAPAWQSDRSNQTVGADGDPFN